MAERKVVTIKSLINKLTKFLEETSDDDLPIYAYDSRNGDTQVFDDEVELIRNPNGKPTRVSI